MKPDDDERKIEWPKPAKEPKEEPSHWAARLADRAIGIERGDVLPIQTKKP